MHFLAEVHVLFVSSLRPYSITKTRGRVWTCMTIVSQFGFLLPSCVIDGTPTFLSWSVNVCISDFGISLVKINILPRMGSPVIF
jgi:hypothetical protein